MGVAVSLRMLSAALEKAGRAAKGSVTHMYSLPPLNLPSELSELGSSFCDDCHTFADVCRDQVRTSNSMESKFIRSLFTWNDERAEVLTV